METKQYLYKRLGKWYLANTIMYGNNIHLNDAHGIKLDSVPHIPSSDLIGLEVKYGRSTGIIIETLPTNSSAHLKTYYPYLQKKYQLTDISDVGVRWTKINKGDTLYYWNDINNLRIEKLEL